MIEKERKFKLLYLPDNLPHQQIQQGYLMVESDKYLRVRIIDGKNAFITYKIGEKSEYRLEFEYEIPIQDGIELMNSTEIKLSKTRYKTKYCGNIVDIDICDNGISTVEVEYITDELVDIPDYCGDCVNGISQYSNFNIALSNTYGKYRNYAVLSKNINDFIEWRNSNFDLSLVDYFEDSIFTVDCVEYTNISRISDISYITHCECVIETNNAKYNSDYKKLRKICGLLV